jgi:hypothetical protein
MKNFLFVVIAAAMMASTAGCAGSMKRYTFPIDWPVGLREPPVSSQAVEPKTPSVEVQLLILDDKDLTRPVKTDPNRSTAEVLSQILKKQLTAAGVNVVERDGDYLLSGVIPRLGYTERSGYPRQFIYTSDLSYQLMKRDGARVVLDGHLQQETEQSVLMSTMTRLPEDPESPERILMDKCLTPTWQTVAGAVSAHFEKQSTSSSG